MIFIGIHGYIYSKARMEYSVNSRNSKPWSRTILKIRSILYDQIMAENSHQMSSKSYAKTQGLRGSCPLHIIHNRMGLHKGRIELSWKLQEQCFMIKIFICISGWKPPERWCMYRTVLHIEYSRIRLLKKSLRQETRSQPSQNIWLSSVHTHAKREENKTRSFSGYVALLCDFIKE